MKKTPIFNYFCMAVVITTIGMIVSLCVIEMHKNKQIIAAMIDDGIENVSFDKVMFSRFGRAKGLIVVYEIKNNDYHSQAYWIVGGKEPIMIWK